MEKYTDSKCQLCGGMEKYTDSKCQMCGGKIIMYAYICHLLKKFSFGKNSAGESILLQNGCGIL